MVYLSKIYTKTGDAGETTLGNGERVAKTHPRIAAYGGVDELNSLLGVCLVSELPAPYAAWLRHVQNDLFDLGADLCVPEPQPSEPPTEPPPLRVLPAQVARLETWIDEVNEHLNPLTSFILPGGTPASAQLHVARAVCRRVELGVLLLSEREPINPQVVIYLNRLSDLLFVLARACNANGTQDVLWLPGGSLKEGAEGQRPQRSKGEERE